MSEVASHIISFITDMRIIVQLTAGASCWRVFSAIAVGLLIPRVMTGKRADGPGEGKGLLLCLIASPAAASLPFTLSDATLAIQPLTRHASAFSSPLAAGIANACLNE
jgi:hypothetical protein